MGPTLAQQVKPRPPRSASIHYSGCHHSINQIGCKWTMVFGSGLFDTRHRSCNKWAAENLFRLNVGYLCNYEFITNTYHERGACRVDQLRQSNVHAFMVHYTLLHTILMFHCTTIGNHINYLLWRWTILIICSLCASKYSFMCSACDRRLKVSISIMWPHPNIFA